MKKLVLLFIMFIPLMGYCQTEEEKYYIYNIVSFEGEFTWAYGAYPSRICPNE